MTYQDITERVMINLNLKSMSSAFISTCRRDIYDSLIKLLRKGESLKYIWEFQVDDDTTDATYETESIEVPTKLYMPLEVKFSLTADQNLYYRAVELTEEEFMRWVPITDPETTTFTELVESSTPIAYYGSRENVLYDGCVGYVFTDANPRIFKWKPAVNAMIKVLGVELPTDAISDITVSPNMHFAFHELLVLAVTIKQLTRMLKLAKNEIELVGLQTELRLYRSEYDEVANNFYGWANRNVNPQIIEPSDFLFDPSRIR